MMVKICGITSLADGRAAVEAGADALGFNFWEPSPRYVLPEVARAICAHLPREVLKVGIFVAGMRLYDFLDVLQVYDESPLPAGTRHWQALPVTTPALAERIRASEAEAFLIDTPAGEQRGGTGCTFDWSLAAGLPGKIVLAGGLGPDNVAAAIAAARPWGVDACSRLESEPGRKDHAKMKEFVRAARSAMP
jgi:phosphoribosylanthranilate isomerase